MGARGGEKLLLGAMEVANRDAIRKWERGATGYRFKLSNNFEDVCWLRGQLDLRGQALGDLVRK
jgi:hypothetical protein